MTNKEFKRGAKLKGALGDQFWQYMEVKSDFKKMRKAKLVRLDFDGVSPIEDVIYQMAENKYMNVVCTGGDMHDAVQTRQSAEQP